MLLTDVSVLDGTDVPEGAPLADDVELPERRLDLDPVDDPLVGFEGVDVIDAYARLGILAARPLIVRRTLAEKLASAAGALPDGFGLAVLDGWRTLDIQQRLLDHYQATGPTGVYVAAVDPDAMRPPHTTGGAVDLTLTWRGHPLALGSDYDAFDETAHLRAFEGSDGVVRRLRRLLAAVLQEQDLAPYPFEWWHWSYGDDVWAATKGRSTLYDIASGGSAVG